MNLPFLTILSVIKFFLLTVVFTLQTQISTATDIPNHRHRGPCGRVVCVVVAIAHCSVGRAWVFWHPTTGACVQVLLLRFLIDNT